VSRFAQRVTGFGPTIFSEMSRLAAEHHAVNLSQGFPDFDGPEPAKAAAIAAIQAGHNQYAQGIGHPGLRQAIAAHAARFYGQAVDPKTEVTVTAGATEALLAALLGLVDPGDEVIVFEPYFDCYVPDILMVGAVPRLVALRPTADPLNPLWTFDPAELAAAFNARTRLILVNTPHNPTGKVFTAEELGQIAALCQRWDVLALSDEVYEHLVYDGARHVRLATLPGMAARTITVSSHGKTFNFTGWKVGWSIAPADLSAAVRRAHQYITFCAPAPLQAGAAVSLSLEAAYFQALQAEYSRRRAFLLETLRAAGLRVGAPQGAYYLMADFAPLGFTGGDVAFCRWLTLEIGVAAIPASAMSPSATHWARFAFCKRLETLTAAAERLRRLRSA